MSVITEIFRDNKFRRDDLPGFEAKLFYEGARRQPYLVKFFVLLFLSTIIAGYGVINDSTATVIGAMIVAPLMTPIMATAAALVMGNMVRSGQSLALVLAGMALVIALSALVAVLYSGVISFSQNTQIVGRVSPRTTDLMIALASGAAGAFAYSRDDIADSLPGVAIAISLVPPLCVVGISISQGEWTAAWGAMLLYMTNFLAILLAGGGVLAFLGLGSVATQTLIGSARRRAFTVIGIGVLIVTIPLAATSIEVTHDALTQLRTAKVVQAWLATSSSGYELRSVEVVGDGGVEALIAGEGSIPSTSDLQALLVKSPSRPDYLTLQIVSLQEEYLEIDTAGD